MADNIEVEREKAAEAALWPADAVYITGPQAAVEKAADALMVAEQALAAACEGALPRRVEALLQSRRVARFVKSKDTIALKSAAPPAQAALDQAAEARCAADSAADAVKDTAAALRAAKTELVAATHALVALRAVAAEGALEHGRKGEAEAAAYAAEYEELRIGLRRPRAQVDAAVAAGRAAVKDAHTNAEAAWMQAVGLVRETQAAASATAADLSLAEQEARVDAAAGADRKVFKQFVGKWDSGDFPGVVETQLARAAVTLTKYILGGGLAQCVPPPPIPSRGPARRFLF